MEAPRSFLSTAQGKLWKTDFTQERGFDACADIGLAVAACDESGRLVVGDWTGELRVFNVGDGARVGSLDANPPLLADRVAAAEKSLAAVRAAESDWGTVEAKRRADEQAMQAAAAKRDGLQKQAEALAASINEVEKQLKDLSAQLDKQQAEMAGIQTGLPAAKTEADTAAAALAAAAGAADEKKALIAARQAEADAAAKELDVLQGAAN